MNSVRGVVGAILRDLNSMYEIDKISRKFRSIVTIYLLVKCMIYFKGFRAIATYRFKNYAYLAKNEPLLKLLMVVDSFINGIDISHRAEIGYGLSIPHAQCIVVGDAIIGNDVKILHGVTLGVSGGKEKGGRRYPTIGDNVMIFAGAKILGGVTIGKNSIIGANAVVVNNIPEDSIAVGIPARVIRQTSRSEDGYSVG
jgi:serine O-acetyltransferase